MTALRHSAAARSRAAYWGVIDEYSGVVPGEEASRSPQQSAPVLRAHDVNAAG
jgi:hypothetical protein